MKYIEQGINDYAKHVFWINKNLLILKTLSLCVNFLTFFETTNWYRIKIIKG